MVCWFTDTLIYFSEGVIKIKRFFETFVICFILCGIFLFFGSLIMESVIAVIATFALFFTILISSYIELQTKRRESPKNEPILSKGDYHC